MKKKAIDTVCFEKNEHTQRTDEALMLSLEKKKFSNILTSWKSGFVKVSNDVIYILNFTKTSHKLKKEFLSDIEQNWSRAGFFIEERKNFRQSGPNSIMIRLNYFL